AKTVEITSRADGDAHATRVTLEYEQLAKHKSTGDILIPAIVLADGGGIAPHGTRIVLRSLVYESTGSQLETMTRAIVDSFYAVLNENFVVKLNHSSILPLARNFVFAWPNPAMATSDLVSKTLEDEDGG